MPNKSQVITPNLWFDNNAKEAAEFYRSVFPQSEISNVTILHNTPSDTPSGDTVIVTFTLARPALHGHQRWTFVQIQSVYFIYCEF